MKLYIINKSDGYYALRPEIFATYEEAMKGLVKLHTIVITQESIDEDDAHLDAGWFATTFRDGSMLSASITAHELVLSTTLDYEENEGGTKL